MISPDTLGLLMQGLTNVTPQSVVMMGVAFVLLYLGAGREQVFLSLEGMRARLEKTPFTLSSGQEVQGVPICGGLASFPIDGRARSELLRKASDL